jgi:hypothetical protein
MKESDIHRLERAKEHLESALGYIEKVAEKQTGNLKTTLVLFISEPIKCNIESLSGQIKALKENPNHEPQINVEVSIKTPFE